MSEPSSRDRDAVNNIFGESLPNITRDESDDARPDEDDERERWFRDNIPPHHG